MNDYDIEEEPILLSKPVFDLFLREENSNDLIALYSFYYYVAKWQKTQQPKCTIDYAAKKLKMSEKVVRKTKHKLMALGLIEDVIGRSGKNSENVAWYIRVKFIWTRDKAKEAWENRNKIEKPTLPKSNIVESYPTQNNHTRNGNTYALSSGTDALSSGIKDLKPPTPFLKTSTINRRTRTTNIPPKQVAPVRPTRPVIPFLDLFPPNYQSHLGFQSIWVKYIKLRESIKKKAPFTQDAVDLLVGYVEKNFLNDVEQTIERFEYCITNGNVAPNLKPWDNKQNNYTTKNKGNSLTSFSSGQNSSKYDGI
jgi:hypothetical protein